MATQSDPAPPDGPAHAIRQREMLAELGAVALRAEELDVLLNEACRLVADGLAVRFCKVLEYMREEACLLVRAGVGWREGVVGHTRLDIGLRSPAGYALHTDQPVISNDLSTEDRFEKPKLLCDHGIQRAINVIIRGDGQPFGVLEADSRKAGGFSEADIAFLQGAANLLGVAVERGRREAELRRALEGHDLLLREADHRVKNSLQLVASLLTLQRSRLAGSAAADVLDDAIARVHAVARAHRALALGRDLRTVALDEMLSDLCQHVDHLSPTVRIACAVPSGVDLDAERAIPLGLIVSELLTNAVRHAYPAGADGRVAVTATPTADLLTIAVADSGVGADFGRLNGRGLGTTIVNALTRQIGARLDMATSPGQGTTVTLSLPRLAN